MTARIPQPAPPGTQAWAPGQVLTTRALTERIWPGFGRIEHFTRPVTDDAEQTQPLP